MELVTPALGHEFGPGAVRKWLDKCLVGYESPGVWVWQL